MSKQKLSSIKDQETEQMISQMLVNANRDQAEECFSEISSCQIDQVHSKEFEKKNTPNFAKLIIFTCSALLFFSGYIVGNLIGGARAANKIGKELSSLKESLYPPTREGEIIAPLIFPREEIR